MSKISQEPLTDTDMCPAKEVFSVLDSENVPVKKVRFSVPGTAQIYSALPTDNDELFKHPPPPLPSEYNSIACESHMSLNKLDCRGLKSILKKTKDSKNGKTKGSIMKKFRGTINSDTKPVKKEKSKGLAVIKLRKKSSQLNAHLLSKENDLDGNKANEKTASEMIDGHTIGELTGNEEVNIAENDGNTKEFCR